ASSDTMAMFTTGGSEANLTGVLLSLASAFPDYPHNGVASIGAPPVLYASEQAHDSFLKVARVPGIGERALRRVRSDERQRLDVGALREEIARDRAAGRTPVCVVGTAGAPTRGAAPA